MPKKTAGRTAKTPEKLMKSNLNSCFFRVFWLFCPDPLGALVGCFPAVFNLGHLAPLQMPAGIAIPGGPPESSKILKSAPGCGSLKFAGKRQESATFLHRSFFSIPSKWLREAKPGGLPNPGVSHFFRERSRLCCGPFRDCSS